MSYFRTSLLFIVLACIYTTAKKVDENGKMVLQYNVVAPGSNAASVNVGGTVYPMTRLWPLVPFYQVTVNATWNDTYFFIADGVSESFTREWNLCKASATYNDFFGRQNTIQKLFKIGEIFPKWERNSGADTVLDDDYISTVLFVGDASVNQQFMDVANKTTFSNMSVAIISRDDQEFFENRVKVNVEDTSQLKPKMKFSFDGNYHKRSSYKLRPSAADAVVMRDKLYIDMLDAVGNPHAEGCFARVYVNAAGLGLYNLQESPTSKDFIKSQFFGPKNVTAPEYLGEWYDATTGADFTQNVSQNFLYTYALESKPGNYNPLKKLIDAFAALDATNTAAIDAFSAAWFPVDYFFRAIALEYLTGSYDSYWFQTTNYVVYNDASESTADTFKCYFIDQDFDQSFGINLGPQYNPYGANYTSQPYTVYVNAKWGSFPADANTRYAVDKLLSNADYKAKFESILSTIVEKLYNQQTLFARIDSLKERLRPEVAWDYGLGEARAHQGRAGAFAFVWTLDQFDAGFDLPVDAAGINWGLKTFITERSNAVQKEFGFQFVTSPVTDTSKGCTLATIDDETTSTGATGSNNGVTSSNNGATGSGVNTGVTSSPAVTGSANETNAASRGFFSIATIMAAVLVAMMC